MDLSSLDLTKLVPILVVGYGYMGKIYVGELLKLGVPAESIVVVDRLHERAQASAKDYLGVQPCNDLALALAVKPQTALVLTNTPDHLSVLAALVNAGVRNIFCEKPVVLPSQRQDLSRLLEQFRGIFCVGYLINFSPALRELHRFIDVAGLSILKVEGSWGKDRTADQRPSSGDWEDEATHMVHTALALISRHYTVSRVRVRADFAHIPFVDSEVQLFQHQRDGSYPLSPNSCSNVALHFVTTGVPNNIPVFVRSSFVSFEQHRRIEVVLGGESERPLYIARLDFDVNKQDQLVIRKMGSKETPVDTALLGLDKISDQLAAFLECAATGRRHPLLTDASQGDLMVRIAGAALASHGSGTVAEIIMRV